MVDKAATPKKESISDMYKRLEAQDKTRSGARGEKSEKMRSMTKEIAKETKQDKLLLSTAYKMCKDQFEAEGETLDRPHYTQTVERAFGTEKDEQGLLWITMDGSGKKPSKKAVKKSAAKVDAVTADAVGEI